MKKTILCLLAVISSLGGYSQDTLYTKQQKKITCKIVEIGESDIRYRLLEVADGPIYVVNKDKIIKYTLANGFTEQLLPDEMSIENEHSSILKNRSVIKINPFSLINNQISFAFEKVLKVGTNLDVEVGYINNSMNQNPIIPNNNFQYGRYNYYSSFYYAPAWVFYSGAYIKPGVKFFLGQDYSVKGLKYAHPLKGRYIKLDLACSFLNFQNVKRVEFDPPNYPQPAVTRTITTDIHTIAYGGFVNYGRQFILGNVLTLEYYVGLGFTAQSNKFTNPDFLVTNNSYVFYNQSQFENDAKQVSNYHGFVRMPGVGLSFTAGFRIGYIIPEKSTKRKSTVNKQ